MMIEMRIFDRLVSTLAAGICCTIFDQVNSSRELFQFHCCHCCLRLDANWACQSSRSAVYWGQFMRKAAIEGRLKVKVYKLQVEKAGADAGDKLSTFNLAAAFSDLAAGGISGAGDHRRLLAGAAM